MIILVDFCLFGHNCTLTVTQFAAF